MGRRRAGTLVLTAAMLAAGIALFLGPVDALPPTPTPSPMRLPWPVLAALFAAAVILRVQVQTDREVHSITLVELPTVLGLFLVDPLGLVVARVAGSIPPCCTLGSRSESPPRAGPGGGRCSTPAWRCWRRRWRWWSSTPCWAATTHAARRGWSPPSPRCSPPTCSARPW